MIGETELLTALSKGNTDAFITIYDRYWRNLFTRANMVLHDNSIAEDIVQDVFTELWNNRRNAKDIKILSAYLQGCVRHACIRHIERYIKRYNFVELIPEILEGVFNASDTMDQIYLQEVEACLTQSVQQMPPKMRMVFEMSRYYSKTRKEIAEELNISPETVKKHIQYALMIVKKDLEKLNSYNKALLIFYILWAN